MAQKSTIFKVALQISDMDRNYYKSHTLTLAQHPSETDERLMMRILAFIMYASDGLSFANGLTANDEPDLWEKDLTGAISLWIEVGRPDERHIKKSCSRSRQVVILSYGSSRPDQWWSSIKQGAAFANLAVIDVSSEISQRMTKWTQRSMELHCTIEDGIIWLSNGNSTEEIHLTTLKK